MNKIENLLVSVMEECSEIQKNASKALRFGLENSYGLNPDNARLIVLEYLDLMTVISILQNASAKIKKIQSYQDVSRELGTLKED